MSERKIKLVIDVKDEEVVKASSSLSRLEKAAKDVGKSGNDIKQLEGGLGGVASGAEAAALAFNPLTIAITAVTTATTALVAGLVIATKYAFELAKSFADYGSEIYKAQQITWLTAETLSTLKIEVEKTGSSFESAIDGLKDYATKIADANKGSKQASEDLNRLGIDGKKYINDFNGALDAAFKAINKLPPGVAQMSAATELFGEETSRTLIPIIQKADGDISNITKTLKEFGIVLSEEDVQASREFNKALGEVQMELRGVGLTLGRELLPVARDAFQSLSGFYKENKTEIKEWSNYIADLFRGAIDGLSKTVTFIKDNWSWISGAARIAGGLASFGGTEIGFADTRTYINQTQQEGQRLREAKIGANSLVYQSWDSSKIQNANTYLSPAGGRDSRETSAPSVKAILDAMREGTMAQESGGRSRVQNARTNATGLFQVMPENIPNWTQQVLNQRLTVEQFRNSPSAQIAVFNAKMGEYLEKGMKLAGGNWEEGVRRAAVQWYGTRANTNDFAQMQRFRADEPSRGEYTAGVLAKTKRALKMKDFGVSPDFDKINSEVWLSDAQRIAKELVAKQPRGGISTAGEIGAPSAQIGFGDAYLTNLQESLQTQEKINESVGRVQKTYEIITLLIKDAYATQELTLLNLGEQFAVQESLFNDEKFRKSEQEIQILQDQLAIKQDIFDLENRIATSGTNDSLKIQRAYLEDILDLRERELNAVISINRSQLELSQSMTISNNQIRAQVYDHLAQQKNLNESIADGIISIYDIAASKIEDTFDKIGIGKIPILGDIAKASSRNFLTNITTNLLDSAFPELSNLIKPENPIAKPIVNEQKSTNSWLQKIHGALISGRSGSTVGAIGGGAGSFIPAVLNSVAGGGVSGGYANNPFQGYNVAADNPGNGLEGYGASVQGRNAGSTSTNSTWTQIKSIFGGSGSAWGGKFGFNPGTLQGIGGLASLGGGLIGGGVGSVLSGVGSGIGLAGSLSSILGIGAIGGPIGLAIGAVIGGAVGLFSWLSGKSKQKKEDQKTYQTGIAQAVDALQKIRGEMESARPGLNIQSLLDESTKIQSDYYAMANTLKTKSIRNTAIDAGRNQIDPLVSSIQGLSGVARLREEMREAAGERDRRILPEFAEGGFTGYGNKYDVRGIVHANEYVFPKPTVDRVGLATLKAIDKGEFTPSFSAPTVINHIEIAIEQDEEGRFNVVANSSKGQETIVKIVEKNYSNRKLKLRV